MNESLLQTPAHRGSICLEEGCVLAHTAFEGAQWVLRLQAPKCAARAQPGSFVHLSCDDDIPMRRPLSILRTNAAEGWVEVLYKVVGQGLQALTTVRGSQRATTRPARSTVAAVQSARISSSLWLI